MLISAMDKSLDLILQHFKASVGNDLYHKSIKIPRSGLIHLHKSTGAPPHPPFPQHTLSSPLSTGGGDRRVVNSLLLCGDGVPQDCGSVIKCGP